MDYMRKVITETEFMDFKLMIVYLEFDNGGICYEFEFVDRHGYGDMSNCGYGSAFAALIDTHVFVCELALEI
ncbi:MAG: hypothetical protein AAF653_21645 [Chloroflexota bacterium]